MNQPYWDQNKSNYWKDQGLQTNAAQSQGLQQFMVQTYTWMALGLAVTGFLAFFTVSFEPLLRFVFGGGLFPLIIAEIALVIYLNYALNKGIHPTKGLALFLLYSALNGLTISGVLLAYTMTSVSQAFFLSAGMFIGMSFYGYVTKKDLSGYGSFFMMAVFGIFLAMVVNLFLGSPAIELLVSLVGVLAFTGLAAYDAQKLKHFYSVHHSDSQGLARLSIQGALSLYLDFINLFLFVLRLLGRRR